MTRVRAIEILRPGPPGEGMDPGQVAEIEAAISRTDTQVFDVRKYSGSPTEQFAAAIAAAVSAGGGKVLAPESSYDFTGATASIAVPDNVTIEGHLGTITTPASINFPVFDVDGADNARVSGFQIVPAGGGTVGSSSCGVRVRGSADHAVVSNVHVFDLNRPIWVSGGDGSTPGTVTNLTLENVVANGSPSTFGIDVLDCDGLHLINCYASGNWLDGLKLRRKVTNVTIIGGRYNENGVSGTGDGMDGYAGGDSFTMIGTELSGNNGAGFQIKTGEENQTDPETNGYVRNVQLIGLRLFDNTGQGGYLTVSNPADLTQLVLPNVTVEGGIASGNGGDGWYLNGRNVTVNGAIALRNGERGFFVAARSVDTTLTGCLAIANSQNNAGSFNAFDLTGHGGRLVNCRAIGVDADDVAVPGDYTSLTAYHLYGFRLAASATGEWYLDGCQSTYHTATGNGIRSDMTAGVCIITGQTTAGSPLSVATRGSIGSETVNTSATNPDDVFWIKASGAPNVSAGWTRLLGYVPPRSSLPTAAEQYAWHLMGRTSDNTVHICLPDGGGYTWKQVTLT